MCMPVEDFEQFEQELENQNDMPYDDHEINEQGANQDVKPGSGKLDLTNIPF